MHTIQWIITTAPEIFLLLAVAIGTVLGRQKFFGFSIGTTAFILIVSVILGQLGTFTIPALLKTVLFSLFVFTIGYRSGPEFFASLSVRTLAQVGSEVELRVDGLPTQRSVLDALEARYPMLRGTIRDHDTQRRRPRCRIWPRS